MITRRSLQSLFTLFILFITYHSRSAYYRLLRSQSRFYLKQPDMSDIAPHGILHISFRDSGARTCLHGKRGSIKLIHKFVARNLLMDLKQPKFEFPLPRSQDHYRTPVLLHKEHRDAVYMFLHHFPRLLYPTVMLKKHIVSAAFVAVSALPLSSGLPAQSAFAER